MQARDPHNRRRSSGTATGRPTFGLGPIARVTSPQLGRPADQAPPGLEVGQQVFLGNSPATIVRIDETGVTVDANHPLAGEALTFELELVSIN